MDQQQFDVWTRRRFTAGGLGALLGLGIAGSSVAKKGRNGKGKKQCKSAFCLRSPFTIEATWTSDRDQDAYLFVPAENAATGPGPYLNFACNSGNSSCAAKYPFACIDEDQAGPGDGVTTVHRLLPGTYEYWIFLASETAAGEVTVVLRDKGGRVVKEFSNPANLTDRQQSWHVVDINGAQGTARPVDALLDKTLPTAARDPFTFVCGF